MTLPAGLAVAWFTFVTLGCALTWTPPVRRVLHRLPHPLLVAALAAALARLVPAVMAVPADAIVQYDLDSYRAVAAAVLSHRDVYDLTGRYPYLPLHLHVFAAAAWLAGKLGLPFLLLVKAPAIAADVAITVLVGRTAAAMGRRSDAAALAMVFALNPVSVLVTGYHGQFDAIPTAFVFTAWYVIAFERGWWAAPASALLFGLAVADKTWPALLTPVLLWRLPRRDDHVESAIAAHLGYLALASAPVLASLAVYEWLIPGGAIHALTVISGYQGIVGAWGFSYVLVWDAGAGGRAEAIRQATAAGPWVLLCALALAYAAAARMRRDLDRIAIILVVTFAAAAGWGVHWLVWLAPVIIAGGRRWCVAYLLAAGAYTSATYLGFGGVLYGVVWPTGSLEPLRWASTVSLVVWTALTAVAASTLLWTLGLRGGVAWARRIGADARRRDETAIRNPLSGAGSAPADHPPTATAARRSPAQAVPGSVP
jgi:hypothetical protein